MSVDPRAPGSYRCFLCCLSVRIKEFELAIRTEEFLKDSNCVRPVRGVENLMHRQRHSARFLLLVCCLSELDLLRRRNTSPVRGDP
jgi:hypothetical protein